MKILFLAKTKTDFVCFANQVNILIDLLLKMNHEIDLYDYSIGTYYNINNSVKKNYKNNIKVKFLKHLSNYLSFKKFWNEKKNYYDIVQIMYLRTEFLILEKKINSFGKKNIVCIYGSDVNTAIWLKRFFSKFFYQNKIISFTTEQMREDFIKIFRIINNSNLVVNPFPISKLSNVFDSEKMSNRDLFFNKYSIDKKNLLVVCGMSGFPNEQIKKLVNCLGKEHYPNVTFLFTFTYGITRKKSLKLSEYVKNKMGLNQVVIIDKYLSEDDIKKLRQSTDILINIRRKDQASGAFIESLSAGSFVITGKWLPYKFLSDLGIFMITIDDVCDLPNALIQSIKHIKSYETKRKLEQNSIILNEYYSFDKIVSQWKNFYETLFDSLN